jgi:hypothetical protein
MTKDEGPEQVGACMSCRQALDAEPHEHRDVYAHVQRNRGNVDEERRLRVLERVVSTQEKLEQRERQQADHEETKDRGDEFRRRSSHDAALQQQSHDVFPEHEEPDGRGKYQ